MFYIVNRVWDVENKKEQKGDKQEISGSRLQREQPIEKEVLLVLSYTTCERVHGFGNVCLCVCDSCYMTPEKKTLGALKLEIN